jgi:DNA-binding LacI/PurR family transcriptional regulator
MAVSLRSRHPSFFGLVLRGTGQAGAISWHHQAFEGQFLAGALDACLTQQLYPVLATQDSPDPEDAMRRVRGVLDGGVFGAVLRTPPAALEEPMRRQIDQGLPVVIVFPEHPTAAVSNTIDVDNFEVGRRAAELLHEAGRRKWVIVREEQPWDAIELRERGLRSFAQEVGASVQPLFIPSTLGEVNAIEWLIPKVKELQPNGVYAASSVTGVAALLACQVAGLRVPEDTCVVGCDASLWRAPGCPSITSIDVSWYAAGELAVHKMAELGSRGESSFENVLLAPTVRRGDTCPGGDEDPAQVIPSYQLPPTWPEGNSSKA